MSNLYLLDNLWWFVPVLFLSLGSVFASAQLSSALGKKLKSKLFTWVGRIGKLLFTAANITFVALFVYLCLDADMDHTLFEFACALLYAAYITGKLFALVGCIIQTVLGTIIISKRKSFDTNITAVTAAHFISAAAMFVMWLIFRFVLI